MSESFEKAVEAAHDAAMAWLADMRGDLPGDEMVCVLTAAIPHLTAQDVPHVIREAWDEGREIGYNEALGFQGPTNSHAKETTDDVPHLIRQAKAEAWEVGRSMGLADHSASMRAGRPLRTPNPYAEDQVGETLGDRWQRHAHTALAQQAAPTFGEPINLAAVQDGDLVRLVLDNGDEVTFTVRNVTIRYIYSRENAYLLDSIRAIHLLHREEA